MKSPVINTICLVEDRISECLEYLSAFKTTPIDNEGLPTEKYMRKIEKMRFLKALSISLANFNKGNY